MEFLVIEWNSVFLNGISWYWMKLCHWMLFHEIPCYFMKLNVIEWNLMDLMLLNEISWKSLNSMTLNRIQQYLMGFHETPCNLVEFNVFEWNPMLFELNKYIQCYWMKEFNVIEWNSYLFNIITQGISVNMQGHLIHSILSIDLMLLHRIQIGSVLLNGNSFISM